MEIARITVNEVDGSCRLLRRIPAGIVGGTVSITYTNPIWDNLEKTVVFRGCETKTAKVEDNIATIPAEVVAKSGRYLVFGVFGYNPETGFQLPLIEVKIAPIEAATDPNADPATDPKLPVWAQLQDDVAQLEDEVEQLKQNPPGGAVDPDEVKQMVEDYLAENPPAAASVTINGEKPDPDGNFIINTVSDVEIAQLAAALT